MNTQKEGVMYKFKGLTGSNNLLETRARLTEFCKIIGTNNLFINYTELISDVLMVGNPVEPDKLPFMENVEPNVQALRRVITFVKGQRDMPGDQKIMTIQLLGSVERAERKKANPYHYQLAACINGLLGSFKAEGVQVVDDHALRDSIDSIVDYHRPSAQE